MSGNEKKGTAAQSDWVNGALSIKKGGTVTIPIGKGTILDKMSFILWLQFTDVGGQQNYFSIWDQSGNRYVPYKDGSNFLRSWTNNWNISSGVSVKAGLGITLPTSTMATPRRYTLMVKKGSHRRYQSFNSKTKIRRHGLRLTGELVFNRHV